MAPKPVSELVVESGQPVKKGKFAQFMEKQAEMARQKQDEAQQKRDEVANAQKATTTTSAQGPAKSSKRSDYQARVDAATRYADISEEELASEPVPPPKVKRKKKKKA